MSQDDYFPLLLRKTIHKLSDLKMCFRFDHFIHLSLIHILRLKAENYSDIIWNNGSTDSINDIVKEGINYYQAKDKDGCSLISNSVGILFDPDIELKLNYSKEQNICSDEFIELSIDGHEDVIWQNGTNSKIQFVNNSGIFYGKIIGKCREHYSDTVVVNKNTYVSPPIINAVQIPINSNTTIQSNSNFTNWYESKEDPNPIFTGPMFSTPCLLYTSRCV